MSTEDKLAIEEIIAKYSYTYDSKDAEAFAQLFVEDAIFEVYRPRRVQPDRQTIVKGGDSRVGSAAA